MKKLIITIATAVVALVATPEKVEARPHCGTGYSYTYVSSHSSCGCPVYTRRVVTGYDCYNRPIFRYYRVPQVHRCRSHYRSPYYRGHRTRHHHHRDHYSRSHHRGHRGITIRGRHGSLRICR